VAAEARKRRIDASGAAQIEVLELASLIEQFLEELIELSAS
jgi:hypothetical protein